MGQNRDTWLYGNKRQRKAVEKAALEHKGLIETPSSDATFEYLSTSPQERAAAAKTRITHWGGGKSESVAVVKAGANDPPASRQLRDPFTTFYVQGIALEPPLPPDRLLNLTEENALHSACLQAKATDACGRGWSFEPSEGNEADTSLIESELPEELRSAMEDLTPDLTFTELLYQAAWEMDAIGWGVWEVVREDNDGTPGKHGKIAAIYPIPSHTIRASLDPRKWVQIRAGRVRYFKLFGAECTINNETGEVYEWTKQASDDRKKADSMPEAYVASELIIFKNYTPRSLWYGLPRWVSAIATIAELGAIREFNVSWFASGGQTDYHMHLKAASLDVAKEMKEEIEQQTREFAGRGHTTLITVGDPDTEVSVNKLGELLREGHFRLRRGDLVKEVLIAHQVPPYRVGWAETGSLGGSAADEMLGAYSIGAIKPIQRVIEDRLRTTLFDPKKGIKTDKFRLKLKELELEDVKSELALAIGGVENGFITPNQAREQLGLDTDDDKDELNEYYVKGVKLGEAPAKPGGGSPFGGGQGGMFGQPGGPVTDGAQSEIDEDMKSADPEAWRRRNADADAQQQKQARAVARDVMIELFRDFERKMKGALVDNDPIDSPQPPAKRPRRTGRPETVSSAGQGNAEKPRAD